MEKKKDNMEIPQQSKNRAPTEQRNSTGWSSFQRHKNINSKRLAELQSFMMLSKVAKNKNTTYVQ